MDTEPQKDKYNQAKLELVSNLMLIYEELLQELGIDFEPPMDDKILLNTPAARKLETIAIYAETGEGDPQDISGLIQNILMDLHAPRVSSLVNQYSIPDQFWSQSMGILIAKALSRLHGNELLTIKEAALLAGVSMPTISIAIDTGKLASYVDPTTGKRQRHRRVLRSEVLKRWVSKS